MIQELMRRIRDIQNDVLGLTEIIPEGTVGRSAVVLAFESLRLSWYMMRNDSVGVSEKMSYVTAAYHAVVKESKSS